MSGGGAERDSRGRAEQLTHVLETLEKARKFVRGRHSSIPYGPMSLVVELDAACGTIQAAIEAASDSPAAPPPPDPDDPTLADEWRETANEWKDTAIRWQTDVCEALGIPPKARVDVLKAIAALRSAATPGPDYTRTRILTAAEQAECPDPCDCICHKMSDELSATPSGAGVSGPTSGAGSSMAGAARWVIVVTGEGATARFATDANLRNELHSAWCVCGKPWASCETEGVAEGIHKMDDDDEWFNDEDGQRFGISWRCETGTIAVYKLALAMHEEAPQVRPKPASSAPPAGEGSKL